MANQDYGAALSRYLDPSETGFDTVVSAKGLYVLDSELLLGQEIKRAESMEQVQYTMPSGFIRAGQAPGEWDFRMESNALHLINRPVVHVNGWVIPLEYTNTSTAGENQITLNAPPASAGSIGVDFVYLEVWRQVVRANPSTTGKPSLDKIYRHGNVLSPSGVWLDDELIDTDPGLPGLESSYRIQRQYRLKSARLNSTQNKLGYTDAAVFAQGPNASLSVFTYSGVEGDPGLWRAGDGDPTNALNTVDGYVYSIPLALVYRRNSQPFDFLGNGNGGAAIAAGTSDRPDGFFSDGVEATDLQDARRHVEFQGMDWERELESSLSLLLDGELDTWATNTAHTGFYVGGSELAGTSYLKADDLVASTGVPSDPASGNGFGAADGIRKVYSDRPVVQEHVVRFPSSGNWAAGDTLTFDLTANSSLGVPLADEQPAGTVITSVSAVTLNDTDGSNGAYEMPVSLVSGLGTQTVVITLTAPAVTSSAEIWVLFEVTYPVGAGLNAQVKSAAANFDVLVHSPPAFDASIGGTFTSDQAGRDAVRTFLQVAYEERGAHREVAVTHTTNNAVVETIYAKDATTIILPEYLFEGKAGSTNGVMTVQATGGGSFFTVDPARTQGRQVGIAVGGPLPAGDTQVDVTYYPARALPTNGSAVTFYYETPGIQAIQFEYLQNATANNELEVTPLHISSHLYVGTTGSGSPLEAYPYPAPMAQIPVHINAPYDSEAELSAPSPVSIDDFDATSGFLRLPQLVPLAKVATMTFQDPVNVTTENAEFLDHYTNVVTPGYRPSAFAQSLSALAEHKVFVPCIVRLNQDTDFARKGEILMLILANYTEASPHNRLGFTDSGNTTCAALYRLSGHPLAY
jgi:hypothetical protein